MICATSGSGIVGEEAEQTFHIVGIAYIVSAVDDQMFLPKLVAVVFCILMPLVEIELEQTCICCILIFFLCRFFPAIISCQVVVGQRVAGEVFECFKFCIRLFHQSGCKPGRWMIVRWFGLRLFI